MSGKASPGKSPLSWDLDEQELTRKRGKRGRAPRGVSLPRAASGKVPGMEKIEVWREPTEPESGWRADKER